MSRGQAMISKAERYRCFGEKALASAKEATCEEEKAELLKIAEAWFELNCPVPSRRPFSLLLECADSPSGFAHLLPAGLEAAVI